jgi:hypothetical protein
VEVRVHRSWQHCNEEEKKRETNILEISLKKKKKREE